MTDQAVWPGWKVAWGRFVKSGVYRAARTFIQVYVVTIIAAWQGAGPWTASSLWTAIETQSDTAIGMGIAAALIALGMRGLDALPIPSFKDSPIPIEPARNANQAAPPVSKPLGPGGV